MKLWHLSQSVNQDYDTFDSCVVAAEDIFAARLIHPSRWAPDNWWLDAVNFRDWTLPANVSIEYIGEAREGIAAGHVICASFNAG